MAGTTVSVKRQWSQLPATSASGAARADDALKQFFNQINNLVADVETLRLGTFGAAAATCVESSTTSDLDVGQFVIEDSDGVIQIVDAVTETDVGTTTVTLDTYGTLLYQVSNAGAGSFKAEATQAYTTAALALAAVQSPDADNVGAFVVLIEADAGNWVANTDDFSTDLEAFGVVDYASVVAGNLVAATLTTPESGD